MSLLDQLTKSLIETYTTKLNSQQQEELITCLEVLADDQKYNVFKNTFPDTGEFARKKYPKHLEFFKAGAKYKERALIASNRSGKTLAMCYEVTAHATGLYPDWWQGKRFTYPPRILLSGDTAQTCRDILQQKLLGNPGDYGSGMLPKETIADTRSKRNIPDAVETIVVRHISGGNAYITFKSYDQGREIFQGNEYDMVGFDEEAPMDVYSEALIRTMTTGGFTVLTFTPLRGLTDLVINFLENSQETDVKFPKHVTNITWWDVPHLKPDEIEQMLAATPPQLREARSKGIPTVGSGLIYPVDPQYLIVDDFPLPKHWQRAYALDVGWNQTACLWGAWDRENDCIYLYAEHKQGEAEPVVHAQAIKARGEWLKGVIDPAARGRSQVDGASLYKLYKDLGLKIYPAENTVEAGIYEVWQRLTSGRLKVSKSCSQFLKELALYHRDENGKIVKKNDHLCLAGDTLVATPDGSYPIKYLVDKPVELLMHDGTRKSVAGSFLTQENADIVLVECDDGFTFKCTPDHLLLGVDGFWYPAIISLGIKIQLAEEIVCNRKSSVTDSNYSMVKRIGSAVNIFRGMAKDCIAQFGNFITEKFQKVMQSITRTKTEPTIELKTLNACLDDDTCLIMQRFIWNAGLSAFQQSLRIYAQQNGMAAKKAESGIKSITKILNTSCMNVSNANVLIAVNLTKLQSDIKEMLSVPTIANLLGDEKTIQTLLQGFALFVELNSPVTDIFPLELAAENAAHNLPMWVAVKSVRQSKPEPVYCFNVPEYASFALGNGMIVHNCDCCRYLIMSAAANQGVWSYQTVEKKSNVIDLRGRMAACV